MRKRSSNPVLLNDQNESSTRDLDQVNTDRKTHTNDVDTSKEHNKATLLDSKKTASKKGH